MAAHLNPQLDGTCGDMMAKAAGPRPAAARPNKGCGASHVIRQSGGENKRHTDENDAKSRDQQGLHSITCFSFFFFFFF